MIEPYWKRIAGMHMEDDGTLGVVWMAHDEVTSVIHIYDCALFKETMTPIIVNGMTARGRYIPVAWRKQDRSMAQELLDNGGIDTLPEPCEDNASDIARSLDLLKQDLQASRLRVDRRVTQWLNEYRMLAKDGMGKMPEKGYPLISATRHALRNLDWAVAERDSFPSQANYPKLSIV